MKGDDRRAELLATALEGGPVADEVDPLLVAARCLRELLEHLVPGDERVSSLVPRLYADRLRSAQISGLRLAHPTLLVRDMDRALRFYRDVLGLAVLSEGKWFSELDAGGAAIALQWTGSATRLPQVGDVCVEFRCDDLDGAVEKLRGLGLRVAIGRRRRGAYAELHDPDGHTIHLFDSLPATRSAGKSIDARSARDR